MTGLPSVRQPSVCLLDIGENLNRRNADKVTEPCLFFVCAEAENMLKRKKLREPMLLKTRRIQAAGVRTEV